MLATPTELKDSAHCTTYTSHYLKPDFGISSTNQEEHKGRSGNPSGPQRGWEGVLRRGRATASRHSSWELCGGLLTARMKEARGQLPGVRALQAPASSLTTLATGGAGPLSQLPLFGGPRGRSPRGGLALGLLPIRPPLVKSTVKRGGEMSGLPWEPHRSPVIFWKQCGMNSWWLQSVKIRDMAELKSGFDQFQPNRWLIKSELKRPPF